MNECDWIGLVPGEFFESTKGKVVLIDEALKKKFRVEQLTDNGWLVIHIDDIHVSFAVLECNGRCEGRVEAIILFHGNGIGGNLRELRHSYWGDEGYIFGLDSCMKLIAKSFAALEEFFDVYG